MSFESNLDNVLSALSDAEDRALTMVGMFVEGEAKLRCPVGNYTKVNAKSQSKKGKKGKKGKKRKRGRVGGNLRSSLDHKINYRIKSVIIGTNVKYAIFVEKGTKRQKAQRYLTSAVEENIDKIQTLFEQELGQI